MGHLKSWGLSGAGIGATLGLCLIGGLAWLMSRPVVPNPDPAAYQGASIFWMALPYLMIVFSVVGGLLGGLLGVVIGGFQGPSEGSQDLSRSRRPPGE
jgi:hypothetical protein